MNLNQIPESAIPRIIPYERMYPDLKKLKQRETGSMSQNLPENPYSFMDPKKRGEAYLQQLKDYNFNGMKEKTDFKFSDDPNIGWKLHLNVTPENVKEVSHVLSEKGYCHKYLMAGDASDGKVFTIYIGSRKKTEEEAQQISTSLKGLLSKPVNKAEVEFAPGVVARFTAKNPHSDKSMSFTGPNRAKFHHYGSLGLVWLMDDMNIAIRNRQKMSADQFDEWFSKEKFAIELRAYAELKKEFGEYFSG